MFYYLSGEMRGFYPHIDINGITLPWLRGKYCVERKYLIR